MEVVLDRLKEVVRHIPTHYNQEEDHPVKNRLDTQEEEPVEMALGEVVPILLGS